jgi:hypothetical protein
MTLAALQDLFARVRDGATGVWRLGQDPHRAIFLEKGQIVFAQSTHPLDRLPHLLVEKGKLTQAQMDYSMENLAPGLSIGRNLIQMGFITQRDLLDVAKFQVERVVWGSLGTDGPNAAFEAGELDSSVVRLSLDTPALLLGGLLNLRDRERMLELLGPLDQVLELLTAPPESCLPADLAKAPSLLDGRRSLLDLARESGAEPMRLGALALFLKELQWARPVEAPAVPPEPDLPVAPAPAAPAAPPLLVVEAPGLGVTQPVAPTKIPYRNAPKDDREPTLIESIQAAAQPTANLEHMAAALDGLPEAAPAEAVRIQPVWVEIPPGRMDSEEITAEKLVPPSLPEAHGEPVWQVDEGQVVLPEPVGQEAWVAEPEPAAAPAPLLEPLGPAPEPFPVPVQAELPPLAFPEPELPAFQRPADRKLGLWIAGLALLGLVAAGATWLRQPAAAPATESAPAPAPAPEPPAPTAPASLPAPAPEPVPPPVAAPGPQARWTALRDGKLEMALAQGREHLGGLPAGRWSLRLEIACKVETLQNAAEWMKAMSQDLFVVPMAMKDGSTCSQLFYGDFTSQAAAEAQIPKLPAQFREGGNKPRAFPANGIPARQ